MVGTSCFKPQLPLNIRGGGETSAAAFNFPNFDAKVDALHHFWLHLEILELEVFFVWKTLGFGQTIAIAIYEAGYQPAKPTICGEQYSCESVRGMQREKGRAANKYRAYETRRPISEIQK